MTRDNDSTPSDATQLDLPSFVDLLFEPDEGSVVCIAKRTDTGYVQYAYSPRLAHRIARAPGEYYVCVSTVAAPEPGQMVRRRRQDIVAAWAVLLDDIGTKATMPEGITPGVLMETSPGNFQALILIEPVGAERRDYYEGCVRALATAGYSDAGAGGMTRVFRVPGSINTKPGRNGFASRVVSYDPKAVYELEDVMQILGLEPEIVSRETTYDGYMPDDIKDPVMDWLGGLGRLGDCSDFGWAIRCPNAHHHTDGGVDGYYSPLGYGDKPYLRGYVCFHGHCEGFRTHAFLEWVAANEGPACEVSGVREFNVDRLLDLTRDLSPDERADLLRDSLPPLFKSHLPDCVYTNSGSPAAAQKPTRGNIHYIVRTYGVRLRFNMMTRGVEMNMHNPQLSALINCPEDVRRVIIDGTHRLGVTGKDDIEECLYEISKSDPYHPIEDWIAGVAWDGVSRFDALCASVDVAEPYRQVWPIYLRRWLIQGIQAWHGWRDPQQMASVLTLAGEQGCGKSEWVRSLLPGDFIAGDVQLDLRHRRVDSMMAATARGITELAELDTTFSKSENGAIKAEMSKPWDTYRAPYGRVALSFARCTIFAATVNKLVFLKDETGSRRFLPVEVRRCDAFHSIDMRQLWAEVHTWWATGEQWWLQPDEVRLQYAQAEQFRVVPEVEEVVQQWLASHSAGLTEPYNVSGFLRRLGLAPSNENLAICKECLIKSLGPPRRLVGGVQNAWMIPMQAKAPLDIVESERAVG